MPKRFTATTVITAAAALSACSGGSDTGGTTEPPPDTVVNTTVSTEPTATDTTTTESTTTTSTTTEPPPSTTEPAPTTTEPSIEDQVRAAAFDAYDGYWECLRDPENCDVGSRNLPGSPAFDRFAETTDDLVAGGLYVGEEDVGYMVIESIEINDDYTAVTSCWWATAVLYLTPPIEGAEPTIQNDLEESGRQIDEFVQDPEDGVWKIRQSEILTTTEGDNECPPEQ